MKKYLQNEKGYTLILTLFVILLFTIVGASLMAATIGGAQKNKIRETDIQATELANNGVEYITGQINTELKNVLGTNGLLRNEFITVLENTLKKYQTEVNRISKTGETGDYNVYISNIEDTVDQNGTPNPLRKKVTFISKGKANNNQKQITSVIEIGAQSVLETLKYAVGVNKCVGVNCTRLDGEGNLFLHGGTSITGDIKVDGNVITTSRGYFNSSSPWISSIYPSFLPSGNEANSRIVLGGNVFTFNHTPSSYNTHISTNNFNSSYTKLNNNDISQAFHGNNVPVIVERQVVPDKIIIADQKNVFYFPKSEGEKIDAGNNNTTFNSDLIYPTKKVYLQHRDCYYIWCSTKYDGDYIITKNNHFKNFATDGSLTIESSTTQSKKTTFENGAYIEKDLIIGNGTDSLSTKDYDLLKIDGPIFVNGDVTIKGANAEFNSIMYVSGDVKIERSVINGLDNKGSLIIFAEGNINISNNSVYQDTPSNIKGFFYSNQALQMFGVISNIRIEGGLSARRIVLNAVRGSTNGSKFESSTVQATKNSRLQIIYNSDIMNTYADIKSREPVVKNVDPPQLINREY